MRQMSVVVLVGMLALVLAGCGDTYAYSGTQYTNPVDAPPLEGTNWDGSAFSIADQQGKVVLLFFGYTFCPDICPFTLADLTQVYQQLDDAAEDVAVVFVTVDPERDQPERLAQYIPAFNENFYGVYIAPEQLETVKKEYGVFAEKRELNDASSIDYLIDHSGWIYVIDRQGKLRLAYGHDTPAATLTPDIANLLKR